MTPPPDVAKLIERLQEIAALVRVYEMLAKDEAERIDEAADRLAALSEENERLRKTLEEHACSCVECERAPEDRDMCCRARAALSPTPAAGAGTSLES